MFYNNINMYKKIIKQIKNNKELIITCLVIALVFVIFTKIKTENFKTLGKNKKVITTGGASRDPQADILQIERDHKCNQAGCATRETKQKKHILL